jgi:hypothetical protein
LNDLPKITLSETCQNQIENTKNGTVARAHHLDVIEGDGAAPHEVEWQTIQCSDKKKWSATKQEKQIVN